MSAGLILMRRTLSFIARLVIAAAGLTYIAVSITWHDQIDASGQVTQAGFVTMLAEARWSLLIAGFLGVAAIFPAQAMRWFMLMRARGMEVSYARALRLTLVGTFFNFCMPGTTGGDVVRAYYAARRSDRRADAIMSVIFDRLTGLLGLILLSGMVGLFMLEHEVVRYVTLFAWGMLTCLAVGGGVYFSPTARRMLKLDALIARLPGRRLIRIVDAAAVAYGKHIHTVRLAILLSVLVHMVLAAATALAGYALGMNVPLGVLLTVIPIVFLLGAAPLTYQGLGLMEWLATLLLVSTDMANANQVITMLMMARVYQIIVGLGGAVLMLQGDIHLHEVKIDAEEAVVPPGEAE